MERIFFKLWLHHFKKVVYNHLLAYQGKIFKVLHDFFVLHDTKRQTKIKLLLYDAYQGKNFQRKPISKGNYHTMLEIYSMYFKFNTVLQEYAIYASLRNQ